MYNIYALPVSNYKSVFTEIFKPLQGLGRFQIQNITQQNWFVS